MYGKLIPRVGKGLKMFGVDLKLCLILACPVLHGGWKGFGWKVNKILFLVSIDIPWLSSVTYFGCLFLTVVRYFWVAVLWFLTLPY